MTAFATVEGRTLAAAMKTINLVVERRTTIPILTMVRLRIKDQSWLELIGTDLDMHIATFIDVIDLGSADFDVCVNAATLERIARQAGPAPVKITPRPPQEPRGEGDKVKVSTVVEYQTVDIDVAEGDASYTLQGQPAADWPSFPDVKEWKPLESFTNGRLASLLDKVSPCISTEETRYYLNGVCWQIDTIGRHMVATNGHRLAACTYDNNPDEAAASSIIIPHTAVKVLSKIAKGKDAAVSDATELHHLRFDIGRVTLLTKTIDGTFPDWRRVVPKDVPHTIEFDADLLRQAVERVTMLSSERGRAVRIFRDVDDKAAVMVRNPGSGEATAKAFATWPTVPADPPRPEHGDGITYGGLPGFTSFGFSARYLMQALGKKPGKFTLRYTDSGSPFLVDDGDEEMTRVLMPMRVD